MAGDLDQQTLAGAGLAGGLEEALAPVAEVKEHGADRLDPADDAGEMHGLEPRGAVGFGRVDHQVVQAPVDHQRGEGGPGGLVLEDQHGAALHAGVPSQVTGTPAPWRRFATSTRGRPTTLV